MRGSTLRSIIVMLKDAGVKELHLKISCPPIKHSCFYGIDTPECKDLIAANKSVEEIKKVIGIDSLAFLSIDGLYRAVKGRCVTMLHRNIVMLASLVITQLVSNLLLMKVRFFLCYINSFKNRFLHNHIVFAWASFE